MTQAPLFAAGEEAPELRGYRSAVRDIQEIRFQNFGFLIQELEADLGRPRGVMARLSTLSGVPASLLSMLSSGALHSETGRRRQIGDDTARKLEAGMGKEANWLDVDREQARDHREAAALDRWRKLTPRQRETILKLMDDLSGRDTSAPPVTEQAA